jgi:hypothetical protein
MLQSVLTALLHQHRSIELLVHDMPSTSFGPLWSHLGYTDKAFRAWVESSVPAGLEDLAFRWRTYVQLLKSKKVPFLFACSMLGPTGPGQDDNQLSFHALS